MRPGTPGFLGERLREARESRGLTAVALSEVVGVSRAAMSQYEKGHQSPAPNVMERISTCLNIPVAFFMRPIASRRMGSLFYRSMSAATQRDRQRAVHRHDWTKDIVHFVSQFVRLAEVDFPAVEANPNPERISNEFIEGVASDLRAEWKLGSGPIANVTWLLENHGAIVTRWDLGSVALDAFSEWADRGDRPYVVLSAGKGSASRSRFDACHELAHLLLHRNLPADYLSNPVTFKQIEAQAHYFASAFLLPQDSFAEDFRTPSLDCLRSLKPKWRVSIGAMIMRASQLGLITPEQTRLLWVGMGRRKWRTNEPLDDTLEVEEPRFLRRSIELLVTKGIVSASELPTRLALSPHDIEDLVGLEPGYLSRAESELRLNDEEPAILKFRGA